MSIYEYRPMLIFFVVVAAILGAVLGSFLNCAAWRIVRDESFLKGRSHCPACGHELGPAELVPILSWIFLRGRCRWCGEKVSIRYPLTELFFAAVSVLCLLRFDLTALCLRNYVFLCCLFCLTLTDLDSCIIPDGCHIIAAVTWVVALPFCGGGLRDTLLRLLAAVVFGGGMLAFSLVFDRILGKDTMGGGDIKLLAVCGLYLGLIGSLLALVLACVFGLLFALVRRKRMGEPFPFGPSIAGAAAIVLLFGEPVINWYIGLFA